MEGVLPRLRHSSQSPNAASYTKCSGRFRVFIGGFGRVFQMSVGQYSGTAVNIPCWPVDASP